MGLAAAVILVLAMGALTTIAHSQNAPAKYPPPSPPEDTSAFGSGIQRTMTLLATSTPDHRNTVRILFYGQSITEQNWSKQVADDLRRRFPHADLVIENRAIGGFASQLLVKDAEEALYSFYPDLVIFHVYGSHIEYENIIRRLRERTTAEILMQTDHVTKDEELTEETNPAKLTPQNWSAWFNHAFLPTTAQKYGAELLDQRAEWKRYLRENKLSAAALLKDGVHLNAHGCFVMAELVKPHLRYRPDLAKTKTENPIRMITLGKTSNWKNGRLTVPFEGNRVDLIATNGAATGSGAAAKVLIDGKKPSEFPELYGFTRSTVYPGTPWPGIMKYSSDKPLLLEEWTARILQSDDDLKKFTFSVSGSKTGPDGEGKNTERFVSRSGRIVIEPEDWSLDRSRDFTKKPIPPNFEFKWSVVPYFVDRYETPATPDKTREYATTLAQGLHNGPHTLEIISESGKPLPLQAIRVYRPSFRPAAVVKEKQP